ncbi:hypothetical protein L9F63_009454 [Diploptera punctata]|uniref:Astakine n=1 Tax=Diploptera punctata TaxID=6984 RepID=A0AAD8AMA2_DIPPU|nr:hypothetical protein L9F63_009454 [Diploptera punctata]
MELYKLMTVVILASLLTCCHTKRNFHIECLDTEDCADTHCCLLGGFRYSIPRCAQLGDVGAICRPSGEPFNTTVSYPDGEGDVNLRNVYWLYCSCQDGLYCDRQSHTCQKEK